MNELKGKIGLVTGASRGIGKAIAMALARAGADVAVNFRIDAKSARAVIEQIRREGARSIMIQADVPPGRRSPGWLPQSKRNWDPSQSS